MCAFFEIVRTWSCWPITRLLHSSFFSPLLGSLLLIFIFISQWPHERLFKQSLSFYIVTDLHRHVRATSAVPLMETGIWYTSFESGYAPRYRSTHKQVPRSDVQLTLISTRFSRKSHHIFKYWGISYKIKISLDFAAPHRRSSSSFGLLKRQDRFTLPRAEQVRKPLSRYHACSTVRVKNPIPRFHPRSSYSYQYRFRAVRRKRHATVFTPSHTKWVHSTLRSRCTHEERHMTVPVLTHAKSVLRPFSGYHARSVIRQ